MRGRNGRKNIAVRLARILASGLILNATFPLDALAQATPPPTAVAQPANSQSFNAEQLDALLAPIALYPDDLLTQVLMASTFPLEVVAAARWVEEPAHKSLSGDTLAKALEAEIVGCECKVADAVSGCTCDHEQQSALVAAAWLCFRDAAG